MSEKTESMQLFFDFSSGTAGEDASPDDDLLSGIGDGASDEIEVVDLDDYEEEWTEETPEVPAPESQKDESAAAGRSVFPAGPEETIIRITPEKQKLTPQNLKRAALAFLAAMHPTALAMAVPTRLKKFHADAAAFWSEPVGRKGILKVVKTAVVETSFENIVSMDCSNQAELSSMLEAARQEKARLEAEIRRMEPELKETDNLFSDFDSWDYKKSSSRAYHRSLKRIDELEYALYHGSRLDRMRAAKSASQLYLAVPENTVAPHEIAESWGLIYVMPDLSFRLVKEPETWNCPEENMNHLAQNIAASAQRDVLFANGIYVGPQTEAAPRLGPVPHRRRPR